MIHATVKIILIDENVPSKRYFQMETFDRASKKKSRAHLIMSCTFKEAVENYQECCARGGAEKNPEVCEIVSPFVKGRQWTDDMGLTCNDLSNRPHHEVMQWCSYHGNQINPLNGLTADEACPNLCSVKLPERFYMNIK